MAAGPKYRHADPKINDEFVQAYHDIRSVLAVSSISLSGINISTGTFLSVTSSSVTVTYLTINSNPFVYSPPTSFTPTIAGVGTATNVSFWWYQVGKMIRVWGYFTPGTVAASTFSLTIPTSKTIDTTSLTNATILGTAYNMVSGSSFWLNPGALFCDGSDTAKLYVSFTGISGHILSKANGSSGFTSNGDVSVDVWIPVTQ